MALTHVSYNGYLQRVTAVVNRVSEVPFNARFVAHGHLVNPKGSYDKAPRVALYWVDNHGGIAVYI